MISISPRNGSRNNGNELREEPSYSASFDSYMEALSNTENENAGPLSPRSINSATIVSTQKQDAGSKQPQQKNHMTVLVNGIQKLQNKNQVLERKNDKLLCEAEKSIVERQIYISELEHKISTLENEEKSTGSVISREEHDLLTMLVRRNEKTQEQTKMLASLTEREGENNRSMELLQDKIDEQEKTVSCLTSAKAEIVDQLEVKQAAETELSAKYEESVKTGKDLQIALSDKDFLVAEIGKELDVALRIKDNLKRQCEQEGMDVPYEVHESASFGSLLSLAEKNCIALGGAGNEATGLQKLLVTRNKKIKEQAETVTIMSEREAEYRSSLGLLRAKIDKQDKTIANMNNAQVEIVDQLDARRVAELDLNDRYTASIESHEKTIKQCKDLEIVLADKNFLVDELGKELEVSHRMTDILRKKFEEDKENLAAKHEKEIASLCKNRMVEVEARVKKEVEARMTAKHVAEINDLSQELRNGKQTTKDVLLQLADESFKKDEACRQLREMSYACEEMVQEKEKAAEARRKESEPRLVALKHDVEREVRARYEAKMQVLVNLMEEQETKLRDLKLKQFEVPVEVKVLQKQLDEAREKLALFCRNEDGISVTSGNCMNELITSLDKIKKSLFFSDSNRLEEMTIAAIKEAREKVRESVNKMDETLKVCFIVEEMNRERAQGQKQLDTGISVSSIRVSRQARFPSDREESPEEDVLLNSLTREWKDYHDTKRSEQESKRSMLEKEIDHFAKKLRENTFLLGGCFDYSNDEEEQEISFFGP
jgi:DNA-binding protein YbaB